MDVTKLTLFGGALFGAGLASAKQLDFASNGGGVFPSSYTFALAYTGANDEDYVRVASYDPTVTPADAFESASGWSALASVTDRVMRVDAIAGPQAFGDYANSWAISYAYVSQAADTDVIISWDFSDELPGLDPIASFITIFDFTNQQVAFQIEPTNDPSPAASGSEVFTLLAGINYGITLTADVFEDNAVGSAAGGSAFAELRVVPTPGVATFATAVVLWTTRRRR
ncbi:MAG: hypothetical protein AAGI53_10140 [Planctomycetota bacterium]